MNSGLVANTLYPIEILIKNKGYAIQNDLYQISFLPVISTISTNQGSLSGGTKISITGDGFSNSFTLINIGMTSYTASKAQITYNSIDLTTLADQAGSNEILVYVNSLKSSCETTNCNFTFTSDVTPTVSSIQPTSLTTLNSQFTISGSNFGSDSSKVHVKIGSVDCILVSLVDTSIVCTLAALDLGSQSVDILVDGNFGFKFHFCIYLLSIK